MEVIVSYCACYGSEGRWCNLSHIYTALVERCGPIKLNSICYSIASLEVYQILCRRYSKIIYNVAIARNSG